jgi:hypothetical protein
MRLSDAIQLGAMITSQAFGTLFKGDRACALGAALLAVGVSQEQAGNSVRKRWPWTFAISVNCPSCRRSRLVCEVIVHLNDDHRWTRERIGAWVAGIEPFEPPEDLPGRAMRAAWTRSTGERHAAPVSRERLVA